MIADISTMIDDEIRNKPFCNTTASKSLRVTCYGSSSSKTPEKYLKEARLLGYILAQRGHVCVNGAGSYGCMAAMNDGVLIGNGHVCGVIHEMFLIDNGYWGVDGVVVRDGGAHRVFQNVKPKTKHEEESANNDSNTNNCGGPIREILVAGGNDLQERKKLLVRNCDALVVLPGGPGTWDELWEMACARHLNLNRLPIVCVNVDGYYDPFREMLDKAWEDELIKLPPHEIVQFATSAEEAIRWLEGEKDHAVTNGSMSFRKTKSVLKKSSFFSASPYQDLRSSFYSMMSSFLSDDNDDDDEDSAEKLNSPIPVNPMFRLGMVFVMGTAFGAFATLGFAGGREKNTRS